MLLAREQAHSLLFKTPELFDNGQLLVILERFFDGDHDFHICTRICSIISDHCSISKNYTRENVKITIIIEKPF